MRNIFSRGLFHTRRLFDFFTENWNIVIPLSVMLLAILTTSSVIHYKQTVSQHAAGPTSPTCPPLSAFQSSKGTVSPLIFGTNTSQMVSSRYFVRSTKVWDILNQIHVQFIRIGFQSGAIDATEMTILTRIRNSCMTPLVTMPLHESVSHATTIITTMNSLFGNMPVYYEFSNEPDLHNFAYATPQTYVSDWNSLIQKIKSLPTNGKFGGPTTSQNIPSYIGYFYDHANPKPDFITWHKYFCTKSMSQSQCQKDISGIMSSDVANTKSAIHHSGLPLMITEWNFGTNSDPDRSSDFKKFFVNTMFTELAKNGIFASNQFEATDFHAPWMLVANDTTTAESDTFQQVFEEYFPHAPSPIIPMSPTLPPTIMPSTKLSPSATPTLPAAQHKAEDINHDKRITILDYNILVSCFGKKATTASCIDPNKDKHDRKKGLYSDLNNDGTVDGIDYNMWLRSFIVQ